MLTVYGSAAILSALQFGYDNRQLAYKSAIANLRASLIA